MEIWERIIMILMVLTPLRRTVEHFKNKLKLYSSVHNITNDEKTKIQIIHCIMLRTMKKIYLNPHNFILPKWKLFKF